MANRDDRDDASAQGVAEWLASQHAELEDVSIQLKGIDQPTRAKRWIVYRGA